MIRELVLGALCITIAASSDPNYRLNTPIRPDSYEIVVTPYFDTGDANAFTFDGQVTINFETESVTNQIKLHSEDLTFTAANITLSTGNTNIPLNAANPLEFIKTYSFALINVQTNIEVGKVYTLKIVYQGPIRQDLSGFYRNHYIENGVKKWLGTTQMEPTHARKVYPCFDEPELKATFTLVIDRPENYKPSLANTKLKEQIRLSNGYVRETFYPTPRMSTYVVAFLVSEFEAANYATNGTREFGVFTRPDAKNQTAFTFDFGQRAVEALSAYLGVDYYTTDANLKLDHVALIDFKVGAEENWGLVTYKESLMLYVPEDSTPYFKYRIAQVIAHETAHMWFGNLVTCHWWSNTWLNEGFATYFQDYITSLIQPDVGAGDMLVTGSVYSAYDVDDTADAPPISNNDVYSPAEISGHFGIITYQKAGSVIRMMHHFIGDNAFILGLNIYLKKNSLMSGYPELLYAALEEGITSDNSLAGYSGVIFTEVMSSWITQAGHPVVTVHVDYETEMVTLTQARFYMNAFNSDEIYKIPITYTTDASPNFNNTKPNFVMENKSHSFKISNLNRDDSWVIFNIQETGFYRVNYDDNSWDRIIAALKGNKREQIHYLNRAKIVNDAFALYYSDRINFKRLLDVLEFIKEENNYSVLYAATRGLNKLRSLYFGTEVLTEIDKYINNVANSLVNILGYEVADSEITAELRNRLQVLELACRAGHTGCVQHATKLFKDLKDNGVEITPSLRPVAYCYGLRNGGDEDYEFLWRRMATTNVANEARIIGDALGCTLQDTKLKKYLVAMQEEESPIRTQDLTVPLESVLAYYENVDLVLNELKDNYDVWSTIYPSMDSVLSIICKALKTEEDFDDFESWLSSCAKCTQEVVSKAREALAVSRTSAAWAQLHKAEIIDNLKNNGFMPAPSLASHSFALLLSYIFTNV
ncbi:membrane alanyl aminopeptidase-like [Pectinophora gossypiella]|uniref:membrane alanyl aminopeptidase-like n=1 Tax=Pectinophora gossypiella TaxID=13191 RepID=UPI00214F1702|nr:membrane alanyl aminopeptidase-like [Pectinophora gossypiella]